MKSVIFFLGLAVIFASCSPTQQVAKNSRYYKRKQLNSSGPIFPGEKPCCVTCLEVIF